MDSTSGLRLPFDNTSGNFIDKDGDDYKMMENTRKQ